MRVVLVDDQELVRSALRRILRRRDGLEIAADCADGDELVSGALRAGAAGFVLEDSAAEDRSRALRAVAAGDSPGSTRRSPPGC